MSHTVESLRRKIGAAGKLQAVVRTMKTLAASSIGQYEQAVRALGDYHHAVELGLGVCFRQMGSPPPPPGGVRHPGAVGAVVFGSDQGLVGRFNETVAEHAIKTLRGTADPPRIWAVGERVWERLSDAGLPPAGLFAVPNSIRAVTPLVGRIVEASEPDPGQDELAELHLFYNRPLSKTAYETVTRRLLPLDDAWRRERTDLSWPTQNLPEIIGGAAACVRELVREYLFVSLFQACAESLASENASRLAAMQRADRNIEDLLEALNGKFHQLRQSGIDAELFDVIAGFEALGNG